MKKFIVFIVLLSLLPSCEKQEDKILILDHVSKTQYYQDEIFNDTNQVIYGKWQFLEFSGGIGGDTYGPTYDYLEVVKFGIYGIIKHNSIKEIGKLIITKQDATETRITFFPDPQYRTDTEIIQREIRFQGHDTLRLWDGMADGYFYLYKRVK
jgi:hypothetical protein